MLERFNMKNTKLVNTSLANHFKLSKKSCPTTDKGKTEMAIVPYSSIVKSLMYAMVCTRSNITLLELLASFFPISVKIIGKL